jgi:hypothetical protein
MEHQPNSRKYLMVKNNDKKIWILGVAGFILGAVIGYLYRPPAFLIGQLPFKHVISRGTTLKGLDQIYMEVAQTSFNYLIVGGIIGAILGIIAALLYKGKAK